ncbi:HicB family protein [Atopobacter sp. AH10]|uniref:type II toxin-antitoxin system HicB family antitoxin n=1 Tax=Atopobacter sp. AH10 TaxID=2315861 RepID=UPI000EF25119|nr:type II toxin-antitoxin system HicB family antitoxin [Atopobacter sp. AH10]RLK62540.1 HicB family protein [Atopobacter sp. AH10]
MALNRYVIYPAVFTPEEGNPNILNVKFPDVPGALTFGSDLKEAMFNASEALALMLYDEKNLPVPSDIKVIRGDYPSSIVEYIGVDLSEASKTISTPSVKKNTTIPTWLNNLAIQHNINFSQTLTEALKEKLGV